MKEKTILKMNSGADYFGYALYAFGGLGIEILLMMLETKLYGHPNGVWTDIQHVIHWTITCCVWGGLGFLLAKQLPVKEYGDIQKVNWIFIIPIMIASLILTTFVWNGVKPIIEFSNLGLTKFLIQYIYYAFESLLILLIIAHGQKAFELWFRNTSYIPFGGILLAITWGVIHILTQGNTTGIYTVVQSFLYGAIYILFNKDYKISYIAIVLMFML